MTAAVVAADPFSKFEKRYEGPLERKRTGGLLRSSKWATEWFVISPEHFVSYPSRTSTKVQTCLALEAVISVEQYEAKKNIFRVRCAVQLGHAPCDGSVDFLFRTTESSEMQRWMRAISEAHERRRCDRSFVPLSCAQEYVEVAKQRAADMEEKTQTMEKQAADMQEKTRTMEKQAADMQEKTRTMEKQAQADLAEARAESAKQHAVKALAAAIFIPMHTHHVNCLRGSLARLEANAAAAAAEKAATDSAAEAAAKAIEASAPQEQLAPIRCIEEDQATIQRSAALTVTAVLTGRLRSIRIQALSKWRSESVSLNLQDAEYRDAFARIGSVVNRASRRFVTSSFAKLRPRPLASAALHLVALQRSLVARRRLECFSRLRSHAATACALEDAAHAATAATAERRSTSTQTGPEIWEGSPKDLPKSVSIAVQTISDAAVQTDNFEEELLQTSCKQIHSCQLRSVAVAQQCDVFAPPPPRLPSSPVRPSPACMLPGSPNTQQSVAASTPQSMRLPGLPTPALFSSVATMTPLAQLALPTPSRSTSPSPSPGTPPTQPSRPSSAPSPALLPPSSPSRQSPWILQPTSTASAFSPSSSKRLASTSPIRKRSLSPPAPTLPTAESSPSSSSHNSPRLSPNPRTRTLSSPTSPVMDYRPPPLSPHSSASSSSSWFAPSSGRASTKASDQSSPVGCGTPEMRKAPSGIKSVEQTGLELSPVALVSAEPSILELHSGQLLLTSSPKQLEAACNVGACYYDMTVADTVVLEAPEKSYLESEGAALEAPENSDSETECAVAEVPRKSDVESEPAIMEFSEKARSESDGEQESPAIATTAGQPTPSVASSTQDISSPEKLMSPASDDPQTSRSARSDSAVYAYAVDPCLSAPVCASTAEQSCNPESPEILEAPKAPRGERSPPPPEVCMRQQEHPQPDAVASGASAPHGHYTSQETTHHGHCSPATSSTASPPKLPAPVNLRRDTDNAASTITPEALMRHAQDTRAEPNPELDKVAQLHHKEAFEQRWWQALADVVAGSGTESSCPRSSRSSHSSGTSGAADSPSGLTTMPFDPGAASLRCCGDASMGRSPPQLSAYAFTGCRSTSSSCSSELPACGGITSEESSEEDGQENSLRLRTASGRLPSVAEMLRAASTGGVHNAPEVPSTNNSFSRVPQRLRTSSPCHLRSQAPAPPPPLAIPPASVVTALASTASARASSGALSDSELGPPRPRLAGPAGPILTRKGSLPCLPPPPLR